jgi:hypothetical protein
MTRIPRLASTTAFALAASAADAQETRPALAADSVADAGRREGRAAAAAQSVGGYVALGVLTGLAAGAVGIPLIAVGDAQYRVLGVAATLPLAWTLLSARSGGAPQPDITASIQDRPPAYQVAFRAAYAERLGQRRRRAAIIGGVTGGVVGLGALTALVIAVLSNIGD